MIGDPTLRKLEFNVIAETVAGYCATKLGKRLAGSMKPSVSQRVVRQWLEQVQELQTVAERGTLPPLGGIHDVREFVLASAFPAPLEPEALAQVAETLAATGPLCQWFNQIADTAPSLSRLGNEIHDLSTIAESIYESIAPRGQVRDTASERLASIRHAMELARQRIRQAFEKILRQSSLARYLQYQGATFHSDRMVLPLKAEYRGRIPGIIHRSSDTGATLFVEPAESVELNNTIVRLGDLESKEITRILRLLSQKVAANAEPILSTLRAVGVLDLIAAKCRYAVQRDCICPQIDEHGVLDLRQARHPVLLELFDGAHKRAASGSSDAQGDCTNGSDAVMAAGAQARAPEADAAPSHGAPREVVPIDVRLGDDFDVLVITGPNTGGKTVCLKTIGLMAVLTQCGIPVPAAYGSHLPVYRQIFIDIGDEQSLQQSLSTFSSHLATQLDILKHSGPRSLVLIDELGAGTDPDEGAAIGRSILGELRRLGAKTVVTTHLSALKAVAFTAERVDNACVEFDPESLRPTYRLRLGEPGNSMALLIARRLGMSGRLISGAKSYLSDRTRALNKAIEGTLQSRRQAEQARHEANEAALHAARERTRLEQDRQELLRKQHEFEQWVRWINGLKGGDEVFIKSLRRPGRVVRVQLHRQRALVSAGGMDIELAIRDIVPHADGSGTTPA